MSMLVLRGNKTSAILSESNCSAVVVQLVERLLAKEKVAGSSPVHRS